MPSALLKTPATRLRTVIESARFTRERAKVDPDSERCDSMLEGITFVLARNPRRGHKVHGTIWLMAEEFPNRDPIVVFYSFSDDEVVLHSIVSGSYLT